MTDLATVVRATIAHQERSGAMPPDGGLAIAVVQDGKTTLELVHGLRERDRGLAVAPDTSFELCSLTKAFTAMSVLLCARERGLDLDEPINAKSPLLGLADGERTAALSLRDILAHRAALPAHDLFWYLGPRTPEELRRAVAAMPAIEGGFRRSFVYGNVLYGMLGHAFPDLFGTPWAEAVRARLTDPLKMTSTGPEPLGENVALPYVGTRRVPAIDSSVIAAAGGMHTTLRDLTRWLGFWTNGGRDSEGAEIADASQLDEALRSHMPASEVSPVLLHGLEWLSPPSARSDLRYGLGWFVGRSEGERVAFHPGFIDGFSHVAVLLPDRRTGLVVLSNINYSAAPGLIAQAVVEALRGHAPAEEAADDPAVGRYRNELFGEASVIADGGRIYFEHRGHRWPWARTAEQAAQVVATAFGMAIPLDVALDVEGGLVRGMRIPMSMDPRVAPSVFIREAP